MPSTAQTGTAQSAITKEAGSGIMGTTETVVEKTPEFCAAKPAKGTPCAGLMPANERAKAPTPVVPPSAASTSEFWVVKLTVVSGGDEEAASDPELPSTFKVPPENMVARAISPYLFSAEFWEMMISPEKPPFRSPVWGVELVKPGGTKVSKAGVGGIGVFPSCVSRIGIEIEVVGVVWWVVNVAVSPENCAWTKLMLSVWPKTKMVLALAEVGRPSKAAHPRTRVHDKSRAKTETRFVADRIGVYSSGLGLRSFVGLVKDPS